jgi:hypothetical protein
MSLPTITLRSIAEPNSGTAVVLALEKLHVYHEPHHQQPHPLLLVGDWAKKLHVEVIRVGHDLFANARVPLGYLAGELFPFVDPERPRAEQRAFDPEVRNARAPDAKLRLKIAN